MFQSCNLYLLRLLMYHLSFLKCEQCISASLIFLDCHGQQKNMWCSIPQLNRWNFMFFVNLQLFLEWFFRNVSSMYTYWWCRSRDKFFSNPEWQVPRILTYFTMFDMMIITMWRMEKMVFLAIWEINLTHKYIL